MTDLPDVEPLRAFLAGQGPAPTNAEVFGLLPQLYDLLRSDSGGSLRPIVDGRLTPDGGLVLVQGQLSAANEVSVIDPDRYVPMSRLIVTPADPSVSVMLRHRAVDLPGKIDLRQARDRVLEGRDVILLYLDQDATTWVELSLDAAQQSAGVAGLIRSPEVITGSTLLAQAHFWTPGRAIVQRVDTSGGTVTVEVPGGIPGTVSGQSRVAVFEKIASPNLLRLAAKPGSPQNAPGLMVTGQRTAANNNANAGTNNASFGGNKTIDIPAGQNVAWGLILLATFKDAAARALTLKVDGASKTWLQTLTDAASPCDPAVLFWMEPLGDVASPLQRSWTIDAGATGGIQSYAAFQWAAEGVDQATPYEAWSAVRHNNATTAVTSKTMSCTTAGPLRRVLYAAARRKGEPGNPPTLDGCTSNHRNSTGTTAGVENLTFAFGNEQVDVASEAQAVVTFPFGSSNFASWAAVALRPVQPAPDVTMDLVGGGTVLEVSDRLGRILVEYDGAAGVCQARRV